MSLAGCQTNPVGVNFHLQKSVEIFDTNSANKIQSQNYKEVKVPCLMPIKVKGCLFKIMEFSIYLAYQYVSNFSVNV